jgi:hypothetical protein
MAVMRMGTEILPSAQGTELLLEHQSIASMESLARMALALRNELRVSRRTPPLNEALCWGVAREAGRTHSTICVATVPSLRTVAGLQRGMVDGGVELHERTPWRRR